MRCQAILGVNSAVNVQFCPLYMQKFYSLLHSSSLCSNIRRQCRVFVNPQVSFKDQKCQYKAVQSCSVIQCFYYYLEDYIIVSIVTNFSFNNVKSTSKQCVRAFYLSNYLVYLYRYLFALCSQNLCIVVEVFKSKVSSQVMHNIVRQFLVYINLALAQCILDILCRH